MRLIRQLAPVLCLAAGCGFAQKPYANDPLLRGSRTVWFARDPAPQQTAPTQLAVEPPAPPATSRRD